jgi:UDP-N-acetylglucosamine--N-acetylmuramyl-(pentapeptide) pyrophosphoryl-undecaprenol N-acetylglucosamine transferase
MSGSSILLAGGGTGGHVFPLLAVADALRALDPELECVFVGTERGIETRVVPKRGYRLELFDVVPLRGAGLRGLFAGTARAARAVVAGRVLVRKLAPRAVVSIGGYAAGPVSLAASLVRIPLALIEPNSVMGLANRLLAPLVSRAYTAFAGAERHFRRSAVLRTGVPIQKGFSPRPYQVTPGSASLLVLGGSQGAVALNETVPRALARIRGDVSIVHQTGPAHESAVERRYRELGVGDRARVISFIDDMPDAIGRATLVIGRAGASSLAEIAAIGRPSVLIPFPYAAGDHQRHNALALEDAGAALCVPQERATAGRLAELVSGLLHDSFRLKTMAVAAAALGRPKAALHVAEDLLQLAGLRAPSVAGADRAFPATAEEAP